MPEGGVSVSGRDIAGGAVELTDILGEIPAVCVPCGVFLNCQRAGGYRLSGIPCDEPECGMIAAGEVERGNLEIASVDVSLMQRYCTVACHLLICSAAHAVVGAFHYGVAFRVGKAYRAIFGVVNDLPDTRFCFDAGLVAICIEERGECSFLILLNGGILIERIGGVGGGFVTLYCGYSITDVVVIVLIIVTVYQCSRQFGAGVMSETIVHYRAFASGIAGGGAHLRLQPRLAELALCPKSGGCIFFMRAKAVLTSHASNEYSLLSEC